MVSINLEKLAQRQNTHLNIVRRIFGRFVG